MDIEPIDYRDWVKLPPPKWSLRERIFEFATTRYLDDAWPQWFWLWLWGVTYVEPSVWQITGLGEGGWDDDDDAIPF